MRFDRAHRRLQQAWPERSRRAQHERCVKPFLTHCTSWMTVLTSLRDHSVPESITANASYKSGCFRA
jgi:hypothetical protein